MSWENIKHHFEGDQIDLIDVHFKGLTEVSMKKFFPWAKERLISVENQHGKMELDEFQLGPFLAEETSYSIGLQMTEKYDLSLLMIDLKDMTISMEKGELNSEELFKEFLVHIKAVAEAMDCTDYIVCPEFKLEEAFVVNGMVENWG